MKPLKSKVLHLLICFFILLVVPCAAKIVEISSFSRLLKYVTDDTIVLFDIDDTLIAPKQMLGSDSWFEHRLKQRAAVEDFDSALKKSVAEWEAVRLLSDVELIDPKCVSIISKLGCSAMGLTVQTTGMVEKTISQLLEKKIDFSKNAPVRSDHCFLQNGRKNIFRKGILFTAGGNKEDALFTLFAKVGYIPKKIVFVDDKEKNLIGMEAAAAKRGIPFVGLRFAGADLRKKAFDPKLFEF